MPHMSKTSDTTLVLGGTGKTGARVANKLRQRGLAVRTAARNGGDVRFDWDDARTYGRALDGADRVYLMPPVLRTTFAPQVAAFLDLAEAAGARHVTLLSAYGMDCAPAGTALRDAERGLMSRSALTHSIVRPAWFMQNFSETFLTPVDGVIAVPTGAGAEAFVDVEDIASVAAATLADPASHAGAEYAPTGPDALTVARAAELIAGAVGEPIRHVDVDPDTWISGMLAAGVPAEYGSVLLLLTDTVASGRGSRPNGDVERVTGSPPTSFAEFAQRVATTWRSAARS